MMRRALLLATAAAAALCALGEVAELRRGEFSVKFIACPDCPMFGRYSPDGATAFVNVSKVRESDYDTMARRAFKVMSAASCATAMRRLGLCGGASEPPQGDAANPYVAWMRISECGPSLVRKTAKGPVEARAHSAWRGAAFLSVRNELETPAVFVVRPEELGMAGKVAAIDILELADTGTFGAPFPVSVPAKGERALLLVNADGKDGATP